ncbi:MAG: cell surface protein SprA, partial [Hymenobacter sp.]
DPSGDDFRHHLDPAYSTNNTQLLGRYKDYDNYEGNSPENSQLSSTAYPDKEDLNRDNVVQDAEQYYEYPMNLTPTTMQIGQNYIIDKVTNPITPPNGGTAENVTWYQFRIPVREYQGIQGNGGQQFGFKNIRFMRLYLTGWQQAVVLRMVQPQFVANQWRNYLSRISDPKLGLNNSLTDARSFNISTVSVEENGASFTPAGATPGIPYVQPPGIARDTEYGSSSVSRQQNEQSLRLCVEDLTDGYAKAAYKNISINMLRYKHLRMYLHADTQDPNTLTSLSTGNAVGDTVRAFIRMGTDYSQNYYEYSLPLHFTLAGQTTQTDVWPEANNIDVAFQDFIDAKAERNQRGWPLTVPYPKRLADGKIITILGNPDFSAVQGCMIGILN